MLPHEIAPATLGVLIADDSTVIRDRLRSLVAELPQARIVGLAANGIEVLAGLDRLRPDVLLLDLVMPGLGGLDVLPSVRRQLPGCTVIVLTNYAAPQFRLRCLQSGAHHFLDKSHDIERLPELLRERWLAASSSRGPIP